MAPRRRNYAAETAKRNDAARRLGYRNYYELRLARSRKRYPGITTGAARGHASGGEREAQRLLRALERLPPDTQIAFTGIDRQPDGTWRRARFDLIRQSERMIRPAGEPFFYPEAEEQTFVIDQDGLYLLPTIADAIAGTGIQVLGAKYMSQMADHFHE